MLDDAKSISLSSSIFGVMRSIKNQKSTVINRKSEAVTTDSRGRKHPTI
jgi:hypothetical protein